MQNIKYKRKFFRQRGYKPLITNKVNTENNYSKILRFRVKQILIFIFIYYYIYFFILITKRKEKYYYSKRKKYFVNYNESNLITLNNKLNWLTIYDVKKLKGKCADKILLHEYSKRKLGKDICNKILKIYNNSDEINFDELPEKYVLKTNHGSGYNIIITNKTTLLDRQYVKKLLNEWMKIDYGNFQHEFYYSFIKRKIFAEDIFRKKFKKL